MRAAERRLWVVVILALGLGFPATAQISSLSGPPSGDNQRASVTQWIGPVSVTIDYSSPDVHSPNGEDRAGKIWGALVPYGMANLGFGTCGDLCPWRAGANENTVFRVSHDVRVQGQPLPAGSYGLHMIPGANEWTLVFSKNSSSWGSFFYDAKEDALRVTTRPEPADHHEWLTYEFDDRQPTRATAALKWEKLRVPFTISVDDVDELYIAQMRRELRTTPGFSWQNWVAASQFCLTRKINLAEALTWAEYAANGANFIGQENLTTLSNLAQLQEASGKGAEAEATLAKAIAHPGAAVMEIHQLGRQLLAQKKIAQALKVFEANAKRFPNEFAPQVGLARAEAASGKIKEALARLKKVLGSAPNEAAKTNVQGLISSLETGKAID